MAPSTPEKIGRYQVLERVGRGGMGVLYRGIDPVLEREVAIKVMLVDFSEDEEQMRPRFYREARAVAKLQHRNIVTVFEFAEEGSTPYIVMEFLRGVSLAAKMSPPSTLTLDDKLGIVSQLCSALHYAHDQGIVHRDVKPANIFLLNDGTVKLLDFGIAKVTTSNLTKTGDVFGSASYMSPEQMSGSTTLDGRSDIFSAGVVLYELLAERKPFHAEVPTAIIMKVLHEAPPPLEQFVRGLPAPLVAAVDKAIAKDPAERFSTAGEFAKELETIRRTLPETPEGPGNGEGAGLDATRFANAGQIKSFQNAVPYVTIKDPSLPRPPTTVPPSGAPPGYTQPPTPAPAPAVNQPWTVPPGYTLSPTPLPWAGQPGTAPAVNQSWTAQPGTAPPTAAAGGRKWFVPALVGGVVAVAIGAGALFVGLRLRNAPPATDAAATAAAGQAAPGTAQPTAPGAASGAAPTADAAAVPSASPTADTPAGAVPAASTSAIPAASQSAADAHPAPAPPPTVFGPGASPPPVPESSAARTAADPSAASAAAARTAANAKPADAKPAESPEAAAAALANQGTLFIDFINSFPDGSVEVEIDGRRRWNEKLGLSQQVGGLSKLKIQRASEQLGAELKVAAGDHKIAVTLLNADGEVRDIGTTSLHIFSTKSATLRIRLTRFKNKLQLETAAGEPDSKPQ